MLNNTYNVCNNIFGNTLNNVLAMFWQWFETINTIITYNANNVLTQYHEQCFGNVPKQYNWQYKTIETIFKNNTFNNEKNNKPTMFQNNIIDNSKQYIQCFERYSRQCYGTIKSQYLQQCYNNIYTIHNNV